FFSSRRRHARSKRDWSSDVCSSDLGVNKTMKFTIVSRDDERSRNMKAKKKQYLIDFDLVYNKEDPELVISIGGDGTLLEAFRRYVHKLDKTAFLGVHTGHLGFYTDWTSNELEKLVIEIAKTPFHVVE